MEEVTQIKIEQLTKAAQTFDKSLKINLKNYNELEKDLMKNGQIQKFEYCIELLWKTLKVILNDLHGLDIASPKSVIKSYSEKGYLHYDNYEKVIFAINDRNRLSHIYKEEVFDEIYSKLNNYSELLLSITKDLETCEHNLFS